MPERHTGTVAKWLNHKGIGFITPDGTESKEGEDILVHYQQIKQESEDGFKSLETGSKVEFELEADPKDTSKQVAVNVTGVDGADCAPKQKGKGKGKSGGKRKGKGKGKGKKGKGKGKKKDDEEEEE
jgi:CspA family cold shock protein